MFAIKKDGRGYYFGDAEQKTARIDTYLNAPCTASSLRIKRGNSTAKSAALKAA
jgi:hypothetical protein